MVALISVMVALGGAVWLVLQLPSRFKIQDEYSEVGDQRLCTFL